MLAVARALIQRPKVLLIDEMSMVLAPVIVESLLPIIRQVADQSDAAVVLVEQHIALALEVADLAVVMVHGKIIASGTAEEVGREEAARCSGPTSAAKALRPTERSTSRSTIGSHGVGEGPDQVASTSEKRVETAMRGQEVTLCPGPKEVPTSLGRHESPERQEDPVVVDRTWVGVFGHSPPSRVGRHELRPGHQRGGSVPRGCQLAGRGSNGRCFPVDQGSDVGSIDQHVVETEVALQEAATVRRDHVIDMVVQPLSSQRHGGQRGSTEFGDTRRHRVDGSQNRLVGHLRARRVEARVTQALERQGVEACQVGSDVTPDLDSVFARLGEIGKEFTGLGALDALPSPKRCRPRAWHSTPRRRTARVSRHPRIRRPS